MARRMSDRHLRVQTASTLSGRLYVVTWAGRSGTRVTGASAA